MFEKLIQQSDDEVKATVTAETEQAKCFSVIVDSTPVAY